MKPGLECPVTAGLADVSAVTGQSPCYSWSSGPRAQAPLHFGPQMDIVKLEEARGFLQSMDYSRTTWQDDDGDT